jgi:hypothetical protein
MNFWKGLVTAADDRASMAKTMAWLTFILMAVSWFCFPERSIAELSLIFGGQLAYIYGGKRLRSADDDKPEGEK